MNIWRTTLVAALALLTMTTAAQAGVVVGGTRLVYDGNKKESSLNIRNPDKIAYLIQSWVDMPDDVSGKAPFVITPPLFRLDSGQNNVLRVVRAGGNLPSDKESIFWLNVKSIPSAEMKDNTLQIAVKTRIKLIFRPNGVKGTPEEAAQQLKWQRSGNNIQVNNPTPFYLTFFSVKVNGTKLKETKMVAPFSSVSFPAPGGAGGSVAWQIINDFGGGSKEYTGNL
ncbi:fimbrial biogenesis chaperone [Enterobacillus tribolii]|nr:molecular chaperone [Enterobacillus tribolii]MBW7981708.1 molecular chaperone [Enterobacillus tribolii]